MCRHSRETTTPIAPLSTFETFQSLHISLVASIESVHLYPSTDIVHYEYSQMRPNRFIIVTGSIMLIKFLVALTCYPASKAMAKITVDALFWLEVSLHAMVRPIIYTGGLASKIMQGW